MLRACQLQLEVLLQRLAPVEHSAVAEGLEGATANWHLAGESCCCGFV